MRVKWTGCSYRHSQWLPRKVLTHMAIKKLKNFEKILAQQTQNNIEARAMRREAGWDSDDGDEDGNDVVDGVRAVWLLVERILAQDKDKYLVKWKKLPYDQATWEDAGMLCVANVLLMCC